MIAAWMVFSLALGVALTVAAAALERACRAVRVPGDYPFLCLISDAKDGKLHVMHGKVTRVKVT